MRIYQGQLKEGRVQVFCRDLISGGEVEITDPTVLKAALRFLGACPAVNGVRTLREGQARVVDSVYEAVLRRESAPSPEGAQEENETWVAALEATLNALPNHPQECSAPGDATVEEPLAPVVSLEAHRKHR